MQELYDALYAMFDELSGKFGNDRLEHGIVSVLNDWNPTSNLRSSCDSLANGTRGPWSED